MSVYWNERTRQLLPYVPGEQPKDRKFIKLNTNENPYPPSPLVIEAIQKAAAGTLRLYPDPECGEFREAVAARYGVRPAQVFAGNGSDEILAFAFGAFFESGRDSPPEGAVLFPGITYSFYPVYAKLWDIPYRVVPLGENFSIDVSDFTVPSLGAAFPNPNAPTGRSIPLEDILRLARYLGEREKVFILDEAYTGFGTEPAIRHVDSHPGLLCVHTLSKSASLAGLRAGFAIGGEELIEGLRRVRDSFNSYTMDRLALAGAAAAVKDAAYYEGINHKIISTRERTAKELRGLGFTVLPSEANFLFAAPPGGCGKSGKEFFTALRERGILVRHFNKPRIENYLRISIGADEEMDAFLEACGELVHP